jgi:hypothetical protein
VLLQTQHTLFLHALILLPLLQLAFDPDCGDMVNTLLKDISISNSTRV